MSALKKLNEARKQFHAAKLKKTGKNTFAGYEYFELGDFLMPALTIFESLQLSGVISFGVELATMTVTDLEDEASKVLITSPMSTAALKACHEVQNLGAVQTYLRRYLWVAALEIVEHDALDSSEGADPEPKKGQKVDMSPKARAQRIMTGVSGGDAQGAALAMSGWGKALLDEVWALLDERTQTKLEAAWPKAA